MKTKYWLWAIGAVLVLGAVWHVVKADTAVTAPDCSVSVSPATGTMGQPVTLHVVWNVSGPSPLLALKKGFATLYSTTSPSGSIDFYESSAATTSVQASSGDSAVSHFCIVQFHS